MIKYCPGCGKELVGDTAIVEFEKRDEDDYLEYDIYCESCEWSGIISPDASFRS